MLELKQIESFYPEHLRHFKRNILREYLQYKMLAVIFGSKFATKLIFMGGTAIHIVHGLERFSEDIDFDNRGLSKDEFCALSEDVSRKLSLEGFKVKIGYSFKGAFSADIKIESILYETGISAHREEKILIKLDAQPQDFKYIPDRVIINRFDIVSGISVVPPDILLAQKFYAILNRKRAMGRDFYDALFMSGKVKPNFAYLKTKAGIADNESLKKALIERCDKLNFKQLAKDVEPFIIVQGDAGKIMLFPEFVRSM